MWNPAMVVRRSLIVVGWSALVFFVWWSVPYVAALAVDQLAEVGGGEPGLAGELIGARLRPALRVLLLLWACGAAAALSWVFLLTAGRIRAIAGFFATLIAALYLIGMPTISAVAAEPGASLGGLRQAAHAIVSLAVAWLFAVALGGLLLRALSSGPSEEASPIDRDLRGLVDRRLRALRDEADDDAYARTAVAICADALAGDRCSIFYVDRAANEIRSRSGTGLNAQIRIPLRAGIAGHVARTGASLLVADAYADPRFDRATDARTGYRTASILALPLLRRHEVFAVLQALNKRDGTFEPADLALLERIGRLTRPRLQRMYEHEVLAQRATKTSG